MQTVPKGSRSMLQLNFELNYAETRGSKDLVRDM